MSRTPRFPAALDSTMLTAFRACPQKFYNEFVLRLAPKRLSPDLLAGGAFAAGLEAVRRAFYGEKLGVERSLNRGLVAFTRHWGDYEPPEKHNKTYINMMAAMLDYFDTYPLATDHIQPYMSDGQPAVEYRFAQPLPINHPDTKEPLFFGGRFDMVGILGGARYIVDEKTTKGFQSNWSRQWALRSQFLGYTWACRAQEFPVEGAVVRGIAILKSEFRHVEAVVPIPQWQLDRWYTQTLRDVQRMVDCYNEGRFDHNYGESCSMYGGCIFETLCTAKDPELWYGDYGERDWDPLARSNIEESAFD